MRWLLAAAMGLVLFRSEAAMAAVRESCRLFVTAVLPGLLPYMVLSTMLVSRMRGRSAGLLTLLGWCGGSPCGARLAAMAGGMSRRQQAFVITATATMSPMFLLGTCGAWLGSAGAGLALLAGVLAGGAATGALAAAFTERAGETATADVQPTVSLTLGAAVEQAARTLLMVCGMMALARVAAEMAAGAFPALALPLRTLLEVTAGVQEIAALPLPLAARTALIAAATGFGGASLLLQNRAALGRGTPKPLTQLAWQAVHGGLSGLLTLGLMLLWEGRT